MHLRILLALASLLLTSAGAAPEPNPTAPDPSTPMQDCNRNGIEDSVDIAFGSSADADEDGVPDECEDRCSPCSGL